MEAPAYGKGKVVGAIHGDLVFVSWGHVLIGLCAPFWGLASNAAIARAAHSHHGNDNLVP